MDDYVSCALAQLRMRYGEEYAFTADADGWDGTWRATQRQNGRIFTAPTPRALIGLLQAATAAYEDDSPFDGTYWQAIGSHQETCRQADAAAAAAFGRYLARAIADPAVTDQ